MAVALGVCFFGEDSGVIKGSLQFVPLKSDLSPAMKGFSQLFPPRMKLVLVVGMILVVLPLHLISKHLHDLFLAQLFGPIWLGKPYNHAMTQTRNST